MEQVAATAVAYANQEASTSNADMLASAQQLQLDAIHFLQNVPATLLNNPSYIDAKIANLKRSLGQDNSEGSVIDAVRSVRESVIENADLAAYTVEKLQFQQKLNVFLGQQIETKYVYSSARTGEVLLLDIDSTMALALDKYRGTMRYINTPYLKQQQQKARAQVTEDEIKAAPLKSTYLEVLRRGRQSKRKFAKQLGKKNMLFINWYYPDWQYMQVSSEGDINEAYANFYLKKLFSMFGVEMEKNINDYMLQGVVNVDNVSGLLSGDISIGNIEYAIKSRGASALGDTDIIATATILATVSPQEISQQMLLQLKKALEAKSSAVRQKLNAVLTEAEMDLLKELQQNISLKWKKT